jgi:insertion element IS1 protein InsB
VTNHVERLNLTLRQRVAPLVRRTLSFAKTIAGLNQRLAFFFNHYNHCLT